MSNQDEFNGIEFEGKVYNARHGGPFDRGSADSYYGRGRDPHFFTGKSYEGEPVPKEKMTVAELDAYLAGYEYNERFGDKKDWG